MATLLSDDKVIPAYFVRHKTKTAKRHMIAECACTWIRLQHRCGRKGAIMVDIDDTLIDGREAVANGFEGMQALYHEAWSRYPLHIVTARPDDEHANVMRMLMDRGFCIPPDRLHMLPKELYDDDSPARDGHVEDFKARTAQKIAKAHGGIVARLGDKMWDVAPLARLRAGEFAHVRDEDCYIFLVDGTASFKLPGA